jgi:uncharacterized protein YdhG (YjbR/CyaY superfamily)
MKTIDPGVAAYFKTLDASTREALTELRTWVLQVAPHASETMLYRMPTYLLGEVWVAYKAQKNYLSLYICETSVVAKHAKALAHLNVGKGCIRFKKIEQLPKRAILEMLKESARIRGFKDLPAKNNQAC